jgi:NodT family efflux transporter outer membrane factor (OMF) lipoprotein
VGAAVLAGCAGLPPAEQLPRVKPVTAYETAQSFSAPAGSWVSAAWWNTYGDPQLDALIEEALAGSPSLAIAAARLNRAQAAAQVSGSALKPQISAEASVFEEKQSYNNLSPPAFTPQGWHDYGQAGLAASWELDFFGKNHAALAAATSDMEAARADAAEARLVLSAAVASAYAELARQHAALATQRAALEVRSKTSKLVQERFDQGLETLAGVRQAQARCAAAEAEVLTVTEQLALQRNRIAALIGAGPDRGLSITAPTVNLGRSFALPAELGADLLGRRPDISAARLRAEAASHRIDEARRSFYPNVNLLGFIGVQSLGLNMLTHDGSGIGQVGPAISLPIFNGGKLRGQLRGARAEYAEAVASYDATVLQALEDVADATVSLKALGPELDRAGAAVEAAREAWRIQNNRYSGGVATYLDVLTAEDFLLSTQQTHSDLEARAFSLDVALARALGGGYHANAT